MAQHNVYVNLPWRELGNADAFFEIYRDGKKLGTMTISKGALEWYPTKAKRPYKISWTSFDKMINEYFEG